jgi:elongation factor P
MNALRLKTSFDITDPFPAPCGPISPLWLASTTALARAFGSRKPTIQTRPVPETHFPSEKHRMKATELRPGVACKMDGRLFVVVKTEHTKPGKGPAYVQAKLKDVVTGQNIEKRLNSADSVEDAVLDRRAMEYLFSDGSGATFMDLETYDQLVIPEDVLEDALMYLRPNTEATVICYEERPIQIELPSAVDLEVTDTTPGIKGATATNQLKEATLETGLKTRVPPFIAVGETVRVSTDNGAYMARAKAEN